MAVAALFCGSVAFASSGTPEGLIEATVFSMLATVKKENKDLTAEEEAFIKNFEKAFNEGFAEHIKQNGLETDSFLKFFKANSSKIVEELDLKDAKVGGQTFDEWGRKMMTDVQNAIDEAGFSAKANEDQLKQLVADNMDSIFKMYANKKGNMTLSFKEPSIHTSDNVLDTSAVDEVGDISESVRIDSFIPKRLSNQYIFSLATRVFSQEVPEYISWYEEGDREGALAVIDEGVLKPLMSFGIVKKLTAVKKAAGKVVVNEEVTMFRKRIWGIIQTLFRLYVVRDYVDIVTNTVIANASTYTGTTLDGTIANPTDFHAIGAVAAQIESLNFNPDVIILHPQDKWRMALAQTADGHFYTTVISTGPDGLPVVMGFRVILSTDQAVGTFTLGESGLYRIEETPIQMRLGYGITDNEGTIESDIDHNRFRIIGELFFHQHIATLHAASFVKASFATVKEALLSDEVAEA